MLSNGILRQSAPHHFRLMHSACCLHFTIESMQTSGMPCEICWPQCRRRCVGFWQMQVRNGKMFVNGVAQEEPFINERPSYVLNKMKVPPGEVRQKMQA